MTSRAAAPRRALDAAPQASISVGSRLASSERRRVTLVRAGIAAAAVAAVGAVFAINPAVADAGNAGSAGGAAKSAAVSSGARETITQALGLSASKTSSAVAARSEALASAGQSIQSESQRLKAEAEKRAAAAAAEAKRLEEAGKFFWPTAGGINSPWGMRKHPILKYVRLHGGSDIGGAVGAPIYAVLDGKVTHAAGGYNSGSGNNVRIDHGKVKGAALETSYLHMSRFVVKQGQQVKRGQLIGYVGSTGLSTAPHLHFSVYVNGTNSDPAPWLNA